MGKSDDICCQTCHRQMKIMKRCTGCRGVMYCSRECQQKDWPKHKSVCRSETTAASVGSQRERTDFGRHDNSIFVDEGTANPSPTNPTNEIHHPPLVDFTKSLKHPNVLPDRRIKPEGKCYLLHDEYFTDVPELIDSEQKCAIIVKFNKEKHKISVQNSWTGEEMYKLLASLLQVPLEKLKIIHKGKVLSQDTIRDTIQDKALYQVIGEQSASEDGVDQRDISVMMKQMCIDRNTAVKALKSKGSLIDALLE